MPPEPRTITVAAGQIAARLMNEAGETLAALDRVIQTAGQRRVDLLVLPECAYPAYLLGSVTSYRAAGHLTSDAFVAWLAERAAGHRMNIISGFVEDTGDHLHNAAVLIDERGREIGRARKRFLWHADHEWFVPGESAAAFDTPIGRIGIIICAEARDPELIASLVADGAELIAMPTCWINNALEPGQYYNPQVDFIMPARAREFGVPFVCADKFGLELGTVGYIGQSQVLRADGSVAAAAPSTGETVVAARVRVQRPRRVWVPESRRERLLSAAEPVRPAGGDRREITLAAVPTLTANEKFTGAMGEPLFEPLRARGVTLMLANMPQEAIGERLSQVARAHDIFAAGFPERADVHQLGPAKVGCVSGQQLRGFATSRALALSGAEVLLVFDAPDDLALLRTRAVENRVFLAGVNERSAVIVGTDGKVLARTEGGEAVAGIDLAESGNKLVAPGTDVFSERRVGVYRY